MKPLALLLITLVAAAAHGEVLDQEACRAAVESVRDSVVQIRTVGGLDRIGKTLLSRGPTTGLIVSADGYIVSSAFNFAKQPTSILVRLPSGSLTPAEIVARDKNRMLVLLKVDTEQPLPVPPVAPVEELNVGQWAIALGRTFRSDRVGVSVGVVSALRRMYGRVVQTDAGVSVANYGGPLIDVRGRVLGILVPMSPQSSGGQANSEIAGAEFYDSGIGFAVPLEHVFSILDRWRKEGDLLPGKLGIGLVEGIAQIAPPKIVSVWPNSPAAEADWRPGDVILAIDGQPVKTQADLRYKIVPRYAGDRLHIAIRRGDEELEADVTLIGKLAPYRDAFLGVLPSHAEKNDDSETEMDEPGVVVRGVWPGSPAAIASLRAGDRLVKIGETTIADVNVARIAMKGLHPADEVSMTLMRDGNEVVLKVKLTTLPEKILSSDELPAKPLTTDLAIDESKWHLDEIKLPDFSHTAQIFLPESNDDRHVGLLLWLTGEDSSDDQQQAEAWRARGVTGQFAILFAHPTDERGWSADDLSYLKRLIQTARKRKPIDPNQVFIGGQGKAGQLAYALALNRRSDFRGVVSIDAPLPRTLSIPSNRPGRRLAILAVESQESPFLPLIRDNIKQLREAGYPVSWFQRAKENELLEAETRSVIARWVRGLDRF